MPKGTPDSHHYYEERRIFALYPLTDVFVEPLHPGSAIALINVDENEINEEFINTVLSKGKNIESGLLLSKVEKLELKLILVKHLSKSRDILERMLAAINATQLNGQGQAGVAPIFDQR